MLLCLIVSIFDHLRWGRTFDSGLRTSVDEDKLESSGDEDESSKVCFVVLCSFL